MKLIREYTIWREDGKIRVEHYEDGKKIYRVCLEDGTEKEVAAPPARPRTFAVHGNFLKNKPRYLSTLAQRPGDPNAYVTSFHEAERKAAEIGGEIIKVDDLAQSHPAHASGALHNEATA